MEDTIAAAVLAFAGVINTYGAAAYVFANVAVITVPAGVVVPVVTVNVPLESVVVVKVTA